MRLAQIRLKLIVSLVAGLTVVTMHAQQQVTWARGLTGTLAYYDKSLINNLAVDPWGNLAISSSTQGSLLLPGDTTVMEIPLGHGNDDIFIARYRANGEPHWGYALGGPEHDAGEGVAMDGHGNIYLCAKFLSTLDIDPGPDSTFLVPTPGSADILVAKFDSSGVFQHVIHLVTGYEMYDGLCMGFDSSNNLLVAGYFDEQIDLDDGPGQVLLMANGSGSEAFVAKYDPDGNLLNYMGLPVSISSGIVGMSVRPDGSFTIAGHFYYDIDLDPLGGGWPLTVSSSTDFFASYDQGFNMRWARTLGGGGAQTQRVCEGIDGGVVVCGAFAGALTVPFADGSSQTYSFGVTEGHDYIAALDSLGRVLWFRPLPYWNSGQYIQGLSTGGDGTFYAELLYIDGINVDPGVTDLTLSTTGFPESDMGFARYAISDGSLIQAHGYQCAPWYNPSDIVPFGSSLYFQGAFEGSIDVDISPGQNVLSTGDLALVKYCEFPVVSVATAVGDTLVTCTDTLLIATGASDFSWYLMPIGGVPIATGDTLLVPWSSDAVTYYLEGTNGDCVSTRLAIVVVPCIVGVDDISLPDAEFRVYPMPMTSSLHIETFGSAVGLRSVYLLDLVGRTVASITANGAQAVTLDVHDLAPGRYQVLARTESGQRWSAPAIIGE